MMKPSRWPSFSPSTAEDVHVAEGLGVGVEVFNIHDTSSKGGDGPSFLSFAQSAHRITSKIRPSAVIRRRSATFACWRSTRLERLGCMPPERRPTRYDQRMDLLSTAEAAAAPSFATAPISTDRYKWNLADIFSGWDAWLAAYDELEVKIGAYAALQGTLDKGPDRLLAAMQLSDDIGQLTYKVWYFAALMYDEDQRDNQINAQAPAGSDPLRQGQPGHRLVQSRAARDPAADGAALDGGGAEARDVPLRARGSLPSAGACPRRKRRTPVVAGEPLLLGAERRLRRALHRRRQAPDDQAVDRSRSHADLRPVPRDPRDQPPPDGSRRGVPGVSPGYAANVNTYASLYNGVLQRDWFHSQSRGYRTTLDAALHGNNIPPAVVDNLIAATKAGTEPLRRYHRLRKRVLGLDTYHTYDTAIPLVDFDRKYPYEDVQEWLPASVAPLGSQYQGNMRDALASRWIDVYENPGKRSGAYSAPVYGVHPYMLLNYNDTLDAVFTLAHEMGHSMHTILSNAHQPFVYSAYTIFIAEVPSTLSEMFFLDYMLAQADRRSRAHRAPPARDRRHRRDLLYAGAVRRLRAAGAPAGRGGTAGHRRRAERHLFRAAAGVLRRRAGLRRAVADHLVAHSALLQHAVLRLSVRDLLRVERAVDAAADDRFGRPIAPRRSIAT